MKEFDIQQLQTCYLFTLNQMCLKYKATPGANTWLDHTSGILYD